METTFRCPTNRRCAHDVMGCGAVFEAEPDDEGIVDCPECGIWFRHNEPGVLVTPNASLNGPQQRAGDDDE